MCRGALAALIMSLFAVMVGTPQNPWLCYWAWDVIILPWKEAQIRLEFLVLITFAITLTLVVMFLKATKRSQMIAIGGVLTAFLATLIALGVSLFVTMVGTPENPWFFYWAWDTLALPWNEAQGHLQSVVVTTFCVVLGSMLICSEASNRTKGDAHVPPPARCEECDVPPAFYDFQKPVQHFDCEDSDTASTAVPSPASSTTSSPMFSSSAPPLGWFEY